MYYFSVGGVWFLVHFNFYRSYFKAFLFFLYLNFTVIKNNNNSDNFVYNYSLWFSFQQIHPHSHTHIVIFLGPVWTTIEWLVNFPGFMGLWNHYYDFQLYRCQFICFPFETECVYFILLSDEPWSIGWRYWSIVTQF